MEDAAPIAYRELVRWFVADHGFDELDAYFLLTQAGKIPLGNMVEPKYTLRASIPKQYLAQGRGFELARGCRDKAVSEMHLEADAGLPIEKMRALHVDMHVRLFAGSNVLGA